MTEVTSERRSSAPFDPTLDVMTRADDGPGRVGGVGRGVPVPLSGAVGRGCGVPAPLTGAAGRERGVPVPRWVTAAASIPGRHGAAPSSQTGEVA